MYYIYLDYMKAHANWPVELAIGTALADGFTVDSLILVHVR